MPFEFGDVVLVPFPFTSQATSKRRPATDKTDVSAGMGARVRRLGFESDHPHRLSHSTSLPLFAR
jgi:hypothetical protein